MFNHKLYWQHVLCRSRLQTICAKITNIIIHKCRFCAEITHTESSSAVKRWWVKIFNMFYNSKVISINIYSEYVHSTASFSFFLFFLMKRKALAFCMRYGEPEQCAVQKATGLSGDPEQKAKLGHSLHLLSQRESGRGWRVRTPWAERDRIISEREGKRESTDNSNRGHDG